MKRWFRRPALRLGLFAALAAAFVCAAAPARAYSRETHDALMCQVLLGSDFEASGATEAQERALALLSSASYLALDQFNGRGEEDLRRLRAERVPGLPHSLSAIDFSGNQYHRRYTHRGWRGPYNDDSLPYPDDRANWKARKTLLMQTTGEALGLGWGQSRTCESLAALIYYVHVLGDHMDEADYKKMNSTMILVGGRHDGYDLIHELLAHFDVLFTAKAGQARHDALRARMLALDGAFSELVNSPGGVNSPEKQMAHQILSGALMAQLIEHVPALLREEAYFVRVFPAR